MTVKYPSRTNPRLKSWDYSKTALYHITISTYMKRHILSRITDEDPPRVILSDIGELIEGELLMINRVYPYAFVDRYIIMPSHIHFILVMNNPVVGGITKEFDEAASFDEATVKEIVKKFKTSATGKLHRMRNYQGAILFQRSYQEEIIRNDEEYLNVRNYIKANPSNWKNDPEY